MMGLQQKEDSGKKVLRVQMRNGIDFRVTSSCISYLGILNSFSSGAIELLTGAFCVLDVSEDKILCLNIDTYFFCDPISFIRHF